MHVDIGRCVRAFIEVLTRKHHQSPGPSATLNAHSGRAIQGQRLPWEDGSAILNLAQASVDRRARRHLKNHLAPAVKPVVSHPLGLILGVISQREPASQSRWVAFLVIEPQPEPLLARLGHSRQKLLPMVFALEVGIKADVGDQATEPGPKQGVVHPPAPIGPGRNLVQHLQDSPIGTRIGKTDLVSHRYPPCLRAKPVYRLSPGRSTASMLPVFEPDHRRAL